MYQFVNTILQNWTHYAVEFWFHSHLDVWLIVRANILDLTYVYADRSKNRQSYACARDILTARKLWREVCEIQIDG